MTIQGIQAIHGKALRAFRNNDFNPESAIAELADNSIQAKCKNMKIRLTFDKVGQKTRPVEIAFGDDGDSVMLLYLDATAGWTIISNQGCTLA